MRIAALTLLVLTATSFATPHDHLVPVDPNASRDYRALCEQKLFVTRGEVARALLLPVARDPEIAVSVHRTRSNDPTEFTVTTTEPSKRLWECIPTGDEQFTGRAVTSPESITVERSDAPLPERTARLIHEVWLKMLSEMRPDTNKDDVLDSSREIFSVKMSDGNVKVAEFPRVIGRRTRQLLVLTNLLIDYSRAGETERHRIESHIAQIAKQLLGQERGRKT